MYRTTLAGLALLAVFGGDALASPADTVRAAAAEPALAEAPSAGALPGDADLYVADLPPAALQEGFQQESFQQESFQQDGYYQDDRYGRDRDYYDQRGAGVRVWMENGLDLFRPGERTRVLLRTTRDAYVAVLHIDPHGNVGVLWPHDSRDEGWVDGGRTLNVTGRYAGGRFRVGSGYGIGYVFAVASDEPLDLRRFRRAYARQAGWDDDLNVYGDPFYAMERFERLLVRDWEYGGHDSDYYSYHVGGSRYRYPRYACYTGYGAWYTSYGSYYSDCDVVRVLLRERPYYYDTRHYRGDRSRYYRSYARRDARYAMPAPEHGYKERTDTDNTARGRGGYERRPSSSEAPPRRAGAGSDDYQEGSRTTPPSRQRPTLQRRPAEPEERRDEPRRVSPPARRDDGDGDRSRGVSRPERREEPRREASPPPRREEPAREAPPARERSTPSQRSEPRVRPSSKS